MFRFGKPAAHCLYCRLSCQIMEFFYAVIYFLPQLILLLFFDLVTNFLHRSERNIILKPFSVRHKAKHLVIVIARNFFLTVVFFYST